MAEKRILQLFYSCCWTSGTILRLPKGSLRLPPPARAFQSGVSFIRPRNVVFSSLERRGPLPAGIMAGDFPHFSGCKVNSVSWTTDKISGSNEWKNGRILSRFLCRASSCFLVTCGTKRRVNRNLPKGVFRLNCRSLYLSCEVYCVSQHDPQGLLRP
jgi:hypothetical protein